ncbi:hypothetical protein BC826DRAFT_973096 [Russula brevipes]|nr:hypothetical protein BC826DRAFT_973096 [Russula brevipes]
MAPAQVSSAPPALDWLVHCYHESTLDACTVVRTAKKRWGIAQSRSIVDHVSSEGEGKERRSVGLEPREHGLRNAGKRGTREKRGGRYIIRARRRAHPASACATHQARIAARGNRTMGGTGQRDMMRDNHLILLGPERRVVTRSTPDYFEGPPPSCMREMEEPLAKRQEHLLVQHHGTYTRLAHGVSWPLRRPNLLRVANHMQARPGQPQQETLFFQVFQSPLGNRALWKALVGVPMQTWTKTGKNR